MTRLATHTLPSIDMYPRRTVVVICTSFPGLFISFLLPSHFLPLTQVLSGREKHFQPGDSFLKIPFQGPDVAYETFVDHSINSEFYNDSTSVDAQDSIWMTKNDFDYY